MESQLSLSHFSLSILYLKWGASHSLIVEALCLVCFRGHLYWMVIVTIAKVVQVFEPYGL